MEARNQDEPQLHVPEEVSAAARPWVSVLELSGPVGTEGYIPLSLVCSAAGGSPDERKSKHDPQSQDIISQMCRIHRKTKQNKNNFSPHAKYQEIPNLNEKSNQQIATQMTEMWKLYDTSFKAMIIKSP